MLALIAVTIIGCSAETQAPPVLAKPPPAPMDLKPGAPGVGDEAYPNDGNGGYDALDYQVGIGFDPATSHLDGDTTVTARATQDLSRFNLDLRGLEVASVQIDDKPAQFAREGEFELAITLAEPIRSGTIYRTRIPSTRASRRRPRRQNSATAAGSSRRPAAPTSSASRIRPRSGIPSTRHRSTRRPSASPRACRTAGP